MPGPRGEHAKGAITVPSRDRGRGGGGLGSSDDPRSGSAGDGAPEPAPEAAPREGSHKHDPPATLGHLETTPPDERKEIDDLVAVMFDVDAGRASLDAEMPGPFDARKAPRDGD